jgi:hypothetical protein
VLVAVGIGTGAFALHIRPDSGFPHTGSAFITVGFGPNHFASSPIHAMLSLRHDYYANGVGPVPVGLETGIRQSQLNGA